MTTHSAVLAAPTGLTLTAKLFTLAAPDTVYKTAVSVTYRTNDTGEAVAGFTDVAAGDYKVVYFSGARWVARGYRTFAGTNGETATETPIAAELDPATSQKIDSILQDTGTTLPGLIGDIEGGGGGGLTGPYTRTITVTDADTDEPIEGAKVRLYRTGETGTEATDDDGIASFTVEAATWSYAITASGYTGVSGTIVVSANGNTDVQMEASAVASPTAPDGCVIQVLCLKGVTAQQGVAIQYRAASIPTGDVNRAFLGTTQTATSNSSGIATFEVAQGSGFEWKRGDVVEWSAETAPQAETMNVRSIIGAAR